MNDDFSGNQNFDPFSNKAFGNSNFNDSEPPF